MQLVLFIFKFLFIGRYFEDTLTLCCTFLLYLRATHGGIGVSFIIFSPPACLVSIIPEAGVQYRPLPLPNLAEVFLLHSQTYEYPSRASQESAVSQAALGHLELLCFKLSRLIGLRKEPHSLLLRVNLGFLFVNCLNLPNV